MSIRRTPGWSALLAAVVALETACNSVIENGPPPHGTTGGAVAGGGAGATGSVGAGGGAGGPTFGSGGGTSDAAVATGGSAGAAIDAAGSDSGLDVLDGPARSDATTGADVVVPGDDGGPIDDTPRGRVLRFFSSIQGNRTIAGVDNKDSSNPSSATNQLTTLAGREPALWGGDFGFGNGAVSNRAKATAEAIKQYGLGLVVQFQYHACIPTRDELCSWDDIGGAHPQHLTDAQWSDLVTPGTALYQAWLGRLDQLAVFFQQMKSAGVAPLFRPLHEMNQCVFWWSCHKGPNGSAKLFQITHDYLVVDKGLDNIVWVWDVQDFGTLGSDVVAYHPGLAYFDIGALDIYSGYTLANYDAMLGAAEGKPIAIGECQFIPTLDLLAQQPKWTYFMLWPDFINDSQNLGAYRNVFSASSVLTADEMPGWK
jgi:hypothetical protein